jgi:mono/diheme cytochrome c family protein
VKGNLVTWHTIAKQSHRHGDVTMTSSLDHYSPPAPVRWHRAWAVAALTAALAPAVAGGVILFQGRRDRVVREAVLSGLFLRLESAEWLHDTMAHPDKGYQMPASMTPGMPLPGQERLAVEVSVRNTSRQRQELDVEELELVSADDAVWPAVASEVGHVTLAPGEGVSAIVQFDVPEKLPSARLVWARGGTRVSLLSTRPEDHTQKAPEARPDKWPQDVAALPPGNPSTGAQLFATSYGCAACHGDPRTPDSNMVGPHLGDLAVVAQARIPGKSGAQYIYDSILFPNAFVVPTCARGLPCATPSVMPSYGEILPLQEMADLIAYLSRLSAVPGAANP